MKILKFITAPLVAFLIINTLCFFYFNPLHGSELNPYRLEPETRSVYALEGFGILQSDRNGFANDDRPLADDDYILVMGTSHSKADQLLPGYRFSDILNKQFEDQSRHWVYNLAFSGGKLSHIVKNFKELVTEFPNSEAIVIEITDSSIIMEESVYQDALNQVVYETSVTGEELKDHTLAGQLRMNLIKYCPYLLLTYEQLSQLQTIDYNQIFFQGQIQTRVPSIVQDVNAEETYEMYNTCLKLMREEYDKKIIVIFHTGIYPDVNNEIMPYENKAMQLFEEACEDNQIDFIDMREDFCNYYEKNAVLPYGFMNTSPGTGHLNKVGHQIIADRLTKELDGIIP